MPTLPHFKRRRAEFLQLLDGPVLLFAGGWISRNYPANWSPYRADSTFLFFFPEPEPCRDCWRETLCVVHPQ